MTLGIIQLFRIIKKDFAAPHDIIRHMRMEDVLEYSITNIPGVKLIGDNDDKKVCFLESYDLIS